MTDTYEQIITVKPTSLFEGSKIREKQHLVIKQWKNALDLGLYRKLKKLSIGTNDIEQVSSKFIVSKLNKEGIEENGHGLNNVESKSCWRDSATVMKLLDLKIKGIKK